MHSHELTTGRTFGIRFDPGESFYPTLEEFCRDNGIRQGYIPMFLAAFTEADVVGACERSRTRTHPSDPRCISPTPKRSAAAPSPTTRSGAAAITGHASELILRSLASRPGQLVDPANLTAAADAVARSWNAWHRVTISWKELTTETRGHAAPVTTEIGDLVLRMGRLAWNDPQWTTGCRPKAALQHAAHLAHGEEGVLTIVAAIHQAADALAHVADTNLKAVQIADHATRLYVRTRSLPGLRRAPALRNRTGRPGATAA